MPRRSDFATHAPQLAATVRARLDAHPYELPVGVGSAGLAVSGWTPDPGVRSFTR